MTLFDHTIMLYRDMKIQTRKKNYAFVTNKNLNLYFPFSTLGNIITFQHY